MYVILAHAAVVLALLSGGLSSDASSSPAPQAAETIIWSDGFEGGIENWSATDDNPASGLDYWGITTYRKVSGTRSAWCAQEGTSSVNGLPNAWTLSYDKDMSANLTRIHGDISGYSTVSLSFAYWASSADALRVLEHLQGRLDELWIQPTSRTDGWETVRLNLSREAIGITFLFPGSTTNYEGVYVDDVVVAGIDETPPVSAIAPLPAFEADRAVHLAFTASDLGGTGVDHVEVFIATDSSGPWTPLASVTSSPLTFIAPRDGTYYFHSVATDRAGNEEPPPAYADALTTVDTTAPELAIVYPAQGDTVTSSAVEVRWETSDVGSGVESSAIQLDGGPWMAAGSSNGASLFGVADGEHVVRVRTVDRLGNPAIEMVSFRVNTDPFSPDGPNRGIVLFGIIAGGVFAAALAVRFRRRLRRRL